MRIRTEREKKIQLVLSRMRPCNTHGSIGGAVLHEFSRQRCDTSPACVMKMCPCQITKSVDLSLVLGSACREEEVERQEKRRRAPVSEVFFASP